MRGILMGAIGGAGKGLAENGKAAMAEESQMRMKKQLLEMEEQARAEREAAIAARREKIMSSTQSPEEIERAAVMAGDDGLAKYGSGVIDRNTKAEQYEADQGWKEKDYGLRERQMESSEAARRSADARGWASIGLQRERYGRQDDDAARDDAKRQLYGLYLDADASGNKEDAEAARREGMRAFGEDFQRTAAGKTETYSGAVGVANVYQRLARERRSEAEKTPYAERARAAQLLREADEYDAKAAQIAGQVGTGMGLFQAAPQGGAAPANRKPLADIFR